MKKFLPPHLFVVCLALMAVFNSVLPSKVVVSHPFNLVGIVFFIIGLIFSIAGKRHFSKIGTNIMTFEKPDLLVTDGLFGMSRNPMYLGFGLALVGVVLYIGTLSPILSVIIFITITDRHYIRFEEGIMKATFGDSYANYCDRVRRWL